MSRLIDAVTGSSKWENLQREHGAEGSRVNVGTGERIASAVAGAALVALSLRQKRLRAILLPVGGGLLARSVSGYCPVNQAIGRDSAHGNHISPVSSVGQGQGIKVEERIVINRPLDELYAFWRNFENLPQFMEHLESVTIIDGSRSHWVAKAPAGRHVEWDAEIHNEIPGELIAWRSLPGSDVGNAGSVHFTALPNGATEVRVVLSYEPPAGRMGAMVAKLFGEEPSQQVADDLRRLKEQLERKGIPAGSGTSGWG